MLETPEGILFAGADRLLIYDGASWSQAKVENTTEIRSLCLQGKRLWAGGNGEVGWFERNAEGRYVYTSVTSRLGETFYGTVNRIFVSGENVIFITERKVIQIAIAGGPPKIWEFQSEWLKTYQVGDVIYINERTATDSKVSMLRNGNLESGQMLYESDTYHRIPLGRIQNKWIIGAGLNIYSKDIETGKEVCIYSDNGELGRAQIAGGTMCINEHVYVPTQARGMFIIGMDGKVQQLTRQQGLASDCCSAVQPSQFSGVWVATDEGISFIYDSEKAWWYSLPGPARALVSSAQDLYVSCSQSAFHYTPSKKEEIPFLLRATWARVDDDIYAAAGGKIYKAKTGTIDFELMEGIDAKNVTTIFGGAGPARTLIAGATLASGERGFMRIDPRTGLKSVIEVKEGFGYHLQDKAGRLWASVLPGGVMMYDELSRGTLQIASRKHTKLTLHEGDPLVLFDDAGFVTVKGDKVRGSEDVANPIGTENIDGPAWICGRADGQVRAGVITRDGDGLVWQRKNVPGLTRFKNVSALYRSGNDLWIGGENGVIQVDLTSLAAPDFNLPEGAEISIRNSTTKVQRMVPLSAHSIQMANDEQMFSLSLKTHVWGLLEPPQYESRLLPLEEGWKLHKYGEPIARENLPTGQYTLQLRVRHLGDVGPVTTLQVKRLLPWYLSFGGISLFAVIISLLFFGAVKLRTRQITARNRELEQKILERTQELAKANSAKSEFLAAMSHEIRNPMNGVIGIVKILQEAKLGAREKYYLTTLHRCAEQLRTTVDDVLDFSKIEAGKVTLHLDTFDLADTVNTTISAVDLTGDRLELASWAGQRPVVTGDQGKFTQILTNFFSNALKYGVPPSASIDVYVLNEGAQRCRVTVAVKNAGPDIPPHEQATLFESFTRGEFAKRGRIGGSGLGLSICKKFAETMGGSVGVTSSAGLTVFQLTLPFEIAHLRTKSEEGLSTPRSLHARALAIEDEDYNRLVLGNILTKLGYRVDWACDGKTALQLAQQNGYDLILTDLMLPDTDGGTLTKEILSTSDEPKPPIFAVTAYSTKEKEDECIRAGMAGFISKPITVEKLEAAIQGWADRRRTGARPIMEQKEVTAHVSVQQLGKLGPLEIILPDFTRKIQNEWSGIDRMLEDRECTPAANAAHKLVSAMLLVEADVASDQLRLLERSLRDGALESDIEKVRSICRDEVASVAKSLKAELKRRQRINEAQSPS